LFILFIQVAKKLTQLGFPSRACKKLEVCKDRNCQLLHPDQTSKALRAAQQVQIPQRNKKMYVVNCNKNTRRKRNKNKNNNNNNNNNNKNVSVASYVCLRSEAETSTLKQRERDIKSKASVLAVKQRMKRDRNKRVLLNFLKKAEVFVAGKGRLVTFNELANEIKEIPINQSLASALKKSDSLLVGPGVCSLRCEDNVLPSPSESIFQGEEQNHDFPAWSLQESKQDEDAIIDLLSPE
jgi:hypothetical protein